MEQKFKVGDKVRCTKFTGTGNTGKIVFSDDLIFRVAWDDDAHIYATGTRIPSEFEYGSTTHMNETNFKIHEKKSKIPSKMKYKEALGDRMKTFYENRTQTYLNRRMYNILRVDGRAFHTYTKGFKRPFDDVLMAAMDEAAIALCKEIAGAKCAFVQSDEITVIFTDMDNKDTQLYFDGNIQKITSVTASTATATFNNYMWGVWCDALEEQMMELGENGGTYHDLIQKLMQKPHKTSAVFDSRVFQVSQKIEAYNNLVWRQQDTTRNSISAVAQSLYSHKELENKNQSDMQEMIWQKDINWNDYAPRYKRGRFIMKVETEQNGTKRNKWTVVEPPIFTQEPDFILNLLPENV